MEPLLASKEGVFQFENHRSTGLKNWFLLYQCVAKTLLIFKKKKFKFSKPPQFRWNDFTAFWTAVTARWFNHHCAGICRLKEKKKKVCFSSPNHSDSVFRSKDKKRKKKERNTDLGKHLPYTSNESDFRESTTCTGLFWTLHVTLQPLLTDGQFHLTDLVCSAGSTLQKIFCVKIFFLNTG